MTLAGLMVKPRGETPRDISVSHCGFLPQEVLWTHTDLLSGSPHL